MIKRRKGRRDEVRKLPAATVDAAESAERDAGNRLTEARKMWPRVNRVSSTLSRELEENNFAGRIRMAMEGE